MNSLLRMRMRTSKRGRRRRRKDLERRLLGERRAKQFGSLSKRIDLAISRKCCCCFVAALPLSLRAYVGVRAVVVVAVFKEKEKSFLLVRLLPSCRVTFLKLRIEFRELRKGSLMITMQQQLQF